MRRTALALVPALFLSWAVCAQSLLGFPPGTLTNRAALDASAVSYTGPGDAQGSWNFWGGFRAFSLATAGSNSADIFCVTASTTKTIKTLANGTFDVATLTSQCPADTYHVAKLYAYPTGTSCGGSACDWAQATDANRPVLVTSCQNSQPCMTVNGSQFMNNAAAPTQAQVYTLAAVAMRTGSTSSFQTVIGFGGGGSVNLSFANSANTADCRPGTDFTKGGVTESAFHALQCNGNGASSILADGTSTTTGSGGSSSFSGAMSIGEFPTPSQQLTGKIAEVGAYTGNYSSTLATNMKTFYGL